MNGTIFKRLALLLVLGFVLATAAFPPAASASTPFLGEIRIFSCGYAPKGWALCNGQLLPINQNQALFSLLGTTYGGDGRVNFALPNLQGRMPLGEGNGHVLGEVAGSATHTLTMSELTAQFNLNGLQASSAYGNSDTPGANLYPARPWTSTRQDIALYSSAGGNAPLPTTSSGSGQAFSTMPPYLTLNYCIALQGIFPSQN